MNSLVHEGVSPERSSVVTLEKGLRVRRESRDPMYEKIGSKKKNPLLVVEESAAVVGLGEEEEERRWRSEVR